MIRVLVTGSREWSDETAVFDALVEQLNGDADYHIVVVHGACPTGADYIAQTFCDRNAANKFALVEAEPHPADWSQGKKAGPLRNQQMVNLGADVCLAFPAASSRGTFDCMRRAAAADIPIMNFGAEPPAVDPRYPQPAKPGAVVSRYNEEPQ